MIQTINHLIYGVTLTSTQNLSLKFIKKYSDIIDFNQLIKKKLSKEILCEFLHKFDWNTISKYTNISRQFIIRYKDKLNWNYISYIYKFDRQFNCKKK